MPKGKDWYAINGEYMDKSKRDKLLNWLSEQDGIWNILSSIRNIDIEDEEERVEMLKLLKSIRNDME